ncbi:FAD-dependent oxidoreductase [Paracoccus sp. S-4012]|uniref:NAD(P)/FAD-dependent oxidoreductase n=1 Tax=Paracoccus sp. S-4012 TaxID=2665648 RepID=UPI0012AFC9A9|nr:FAD-dependent oxidoreductase [Paracoccus sp. S-4012]MRX51046.1 FAD-dependent oxidoreductase [Paracoccus sp. S-4012]
MRRDYDVAVIGGGLLGSAIAWGLGRLDARVCVLDEGDIARRASRANFALVWVQGKGLGFPAYADWTVEGAGRWPELAEALRYQTGLDLCYERPGGFHMALSEREMEARAAVASRMAAQGAAAGIELLGRDELRRLMPQIGPDVVGASYCPMDGHVNSLRTFRAFHEGMRGLGVDYRAEAPVEAIEARPGGGFELRTPAGEMGAARVVLAAGNANERLARQVGLHAPMLPTRGQIIVTERTGRFLDHLVMTIRQTDEGSIMIGDSKEEVLEDAETTLRVGAVIADRARRIFPALARLNVVRTWSGIRVMTRDGFPIYDESTSHPGAFVACCHSGVTLAAQHAFVLAPMILAGRLDARAAPFSARRFADAPATLAA